jgi:hypothetical protein
MRYNLIELERDIEDIVIELSEIRAKKGHDYSGTEDTLENQREFGWRGVVIRNHDKQKRLSHFIKSGGVLKVSDESIEDTMLDQINYALFSLILYRQEKKSCSMDVHNEEGFASKARHVGVGANFANLFEGIKQTRLPEGVRFDGMHYIDEDLPNTLFSSLGDWEEYWHLQGVNPKLTPKCLPGMAQTKKKPEIVEWVNDVNIPTGEV